MGYCSTLNAPEIYIETKIHVESFRENSSFFIIFTSKTCAALSPNFRRGKSFKSHILSKIRTLKYARIDFSHRPVLVVLTGGSDVHNQPGISRMISENVYRNSLKRRVCSNLRPPPRERARASPGMLEITRILQITITMST